MDFSEFLSTQSGADDALLQYSTLLHQAFPAGFPRNLPDLKSPTPWLTETMSTGSLTSLSNELILEIIKHLFVRDPHYSSQDNQPARNVLNLGRCSRRLYELVIPTVYSSLHEFEDTSITDNIAKFLCRILQAPALGEYVKFLSINASELDGGIFQFPFSDVVSWDAGNPSRLKAAVEEAAQSSQDALDWYRAIEERKWNAWVALLLSRLPKLEVLETRLEGYCVLDRSYQPWLWKFINNAIALQDQSSTSPLALPKLREVSIEQRIESYSVQVSDVMEFCRLKSVKTFRSSEIFLGDGQELGESKLQFSTTDLSFDWSNEGKQLFRPFLKLFPSLERLHYTGFPTDFDQTTLVEFMEAIAPLKPTLLELNFATDEHYSSDEDIVKYTFGSLTDFVKLRSVSVMACRLTGPALDPCTFLPFSTVMMKSLPRSLEHLELDGVSPEEVPSIMTLIRNKDIYTPSLKELNLRWGTTKYPDHKPRPLSDILTGYPGFTKEEAFELWEDCKAKGVKMVTTSHPPAKPPMKFVHWRINIPNVLPEGTHNLGAHRFTGHGKTLCFAKMFEYPYDGYEAFVREQGGDPDVESEDYGIWNFY